MADAATTVNEVMNYFGVAMKAVATFKSLRAQFISETGSKAGLPSDKELIDGMELDATNLKHHAQALMLKYAPSLISDGSDQPPAPELPTVRPLAVRVIGAPGAVIHFDGIVNTADKDGYAIWPAVPEGARRVVVSVEGNDTYHEFSTTAILPADLEGHELVIGPAAGLVPGFQIQIGELTYKMRQRKGVVVGINKSVADESGIFHPLGVTLFWAVWGWKFDRDRFKKNVEWLRSYGLDYARILCQVNWPDQPIDPDWPDYSQLLGEVIDYLYDQNGLRSELVIIGDGPRDPMDVANKVIAVVTAGRAHKVMMIECSNEGKLDLDTLKTMGRLVRANTSNLVSLTSVGYVGGEDDVTNATAEAGVQVITVHIDRSGGDNKWRQVRQGYDFRGYHAVVASNEPPGPQSSVDTNDSPLQLALMRATGVMGGGAMYVLHIAAMVKGQVDAAHGRPANVWEVANIDAIIKAVRDVDKLIPNGVEDWGKSSVHGGDNGVVTPAGPIALVPDRIWSDGYDHGVCRAYGADNGSQFIEMLLGVLKTVTVTARQSLRNVKVFDPVTQAQVFDFGTMSAGQTKELPGRDDTMVGWIVTGEWA